MAAIPNIKLSSVSAATGAAKTAISSAIGGFGLPSVSSLLGSVTPKLVNLSAIPKLTKIPMTGGQPGEWKATSSRVPSVVSQAKSQVSGVGSKLSGAAGDVQSQANSAASSVSSAAAGAQSQASATASSVNTTATNKVDAVVNKKNV